MKVIIEDVNFNTKTALSQFVQDIENLMNWTNTTIVVKNITISTK